MNLQDAQLCIECEWIFAESAHCTRCGSHVSYPVARRMNAEFIGFGRRRPKSLRVTVRPERRLALAH